MNDWITSIIESMGYAGIALLMVLENVFPPIPSELIMPLAGFVTTKGELNFAGVAIAGTLGSVLGALPLYYLGKWLGKDRLCRLAERRGHWLAISPEDVGKADAWFKHHCGLAVLLCRLVPGVRSLISIPAGVAAMPLAPFLAYTTAGSAVWATSLAYAGKLLGEKFSRVEQYVGPVSYVVMGGIVVAFVVRALRLRARKKSREAARTSA